MNEHHNHPQFTSQAHRFWVQIPEIFQKRILNNVWCRTCAGATTIVDYRGQIKDGDLLLEGRCATCGGKVARLVEAE